MTKKIVAGLVAVAIFSPPLAYAADRKHSNWSDATAYGWSHCVINGNATVVVCDNGSVHLSPNAVRRIRHGHNTISGK